MKYLCLWGVVLLLAACGGATPEPTITLIPPTQGFTPPDNVFEFIGTDMFGIDSTEEVTPTPFATIEGELPVPLPGTLVASSTEDPGVGETFDTLTLVRTGGPILNGEQPTITIDIRGDGNITRNGVSGQLPQAAIDRINQLIREMNFFGAQANFLGAIPLDGAGEIFIYQLSITSSGSSRTVTAMEGYMPQELIDLISAILLQAETLPRN